MHSHSSLSELARRRAASAAAAAVGLPAPAVGSQSVDQTDARMGPPYVGGGYQSGEALEAVASYSRLETLEEQMSIINAREDARDRQLSQITVLLERIASASASSQNLAAPPPVTRPSAPPSPPRRRPRRPAAAAPAPAESARRAAPAAARPPPPPGEGDGEGGADPEWQISE